MDNVKVTFGRRLRALRKSKGLTLEKLGREAVIGYKHIADIERGEKVPSFDAIEKLAAALKVLPYELFLPENFGESNNHRPLRQLIREIEKHSSPAIKDFILTTVTQIRKLETDLNLRSRRP